MINAWEVVELSFQKNLKLGVNHVIKESVQIVNHIITNYLFYAWPAFKHSLKK